MEAALRMRAQICILYGNPLYSTKGNCTVTTQLQSSTNNMVTVNNASDYRTNGLYQTVR